MRILVIIAVFAALCASPAAALDTLKNGEFTCIATTPGNISSSLAGLSFQEGDMQINNFMLGRSTAPVILVLAASAVNHSGTKTVRVSIELLGLDEKNEPVFAISASPVMSIVRPGRLEEVRGGILITPKPVAATRTCIRVTAVAE